MIGGLVGEKCNPDLCQFLYYRAKLCRLTCGDCSSPKVQGRIGNENMDTALEKLTNENTKKETESKFFQLI